MHKRGLLQLNSDYNYQGFQSLSKNIQLEMIFITPWINWSLRRSRALHLAVDFSLLFLRAASNKGQLADGLANENCFWDITKLAGIPNFAPFQDWSWTNCNKGDQACDARQIWTSLTSTTSENRTVVRGAASPTTEDATLSAPNQRSRVSLTVSLRSRTL